MKKYAILPLKTVEHLILMIEAAQAFVHGRSVKELVDDGQMPYCYLELIAAKTNAWTLESSKRNEKKRKSVLKVTRDYSRIAEPDKTI